MESDKWSQTVIDETKSIFLKRASSDNVDKNVILKAIEQLRTKLSTFSLENLEDDIMFHMMPCISSLFLEVYADNQKIDSVEQVQILLENLRITIALTDFIDELLNYISAKLESANLKLLKSLILEIPKCIYLTYQHCKESQNKYQTLMKDSNEILLLYKKNHECHVKFLNIVAVLTIDANERDCAKILIETIHSISNIIEILLGLNIKALADSWKSFCCIIEKHQEILINEEFYCVREIELLELQIINFMDMALGNFDDKQVLQYLKLSGFLLKVALKIINKFWQYLHLDHLDSIYNLVCSIYNYSPEFSEKQMLKQDVRKSIQICLLDVITSFVEENLLHEEVLEQILSKNCRTNKDVGSLELNMRILEYIKNQTTDSLDSGSFYATVDMIFSNIITCYPEKILGDVMTIPRLCIDKLSFEMSQCIGVHTSFYGQHFETIMLANILGNHMGCHFLASATWIQIISQATSTSRKDLISELMNLMNKTRIELSFSSSKVLLLKNFMQKLFSILDGHENVYFMNLYPPSEYIHLWRTIGLNFIPVNDDHWDSLMESILPNLNDLDNIASVEEIMKSTEGLKILAGASNSILDIHIEKLINLVQTLWETNFEVAFSDNQCFKYFVSALNSITMQLIHYLSNDQIFHILKTMEELANNNFMKVELCLLLRELSTRKTEHNMEQNKLNFLISDLFELLLKENDETLKGLPLNTFQQFAYRNQYIIVNNVSRMLPNMNLEQYLPHNSNKTSLNDYFNALPMKSMDHQCLEENISSISNENFLNWKNKNLTSRENSCDSLDGKTFSREPSFEKRTESPNFINKPLDIKRSTSFNISGLPQSKRARLSENVVEDTDTIGEVLQRIKSEIKCLNKLLCKEKPTAKNAQDIKLLTCQLQNILD